jgi:hypothetical protein
LTVERNAPCPCGSGKKYKRCCGLAVAEDCRDQDNLLLNQSVAYLGDIGRRREAFFLSYAKFKQAGIEDIENELKRDVVAQGQVITCSKGCARCCSVYVFATLQECECIVYCLYHHSDVMRHFLSSYGVWRGEVSKFERSYRLIEKLQEKVLLGRQITQEERSLFDTALTSFASRNIPCPFLLPDQSCSIYEVRPFVCAGVVSTSPPDWCSPSHAQHDQFLLCKADINLENEMPYFVRPKSPIIFGCLPELVHDILGKGYPLLSTVQGLEGLKTEVLREPEIQAVLRQVKQF